VSLGGRPTGRQIGWAAGRQRSRAAGGREAAVGLCIDKIESVKRTKLCELKSSRQNVEKNIAWTDWIVCIAKNSCRRETMSLEEEEWWAGRGGAGLGGGGREIQIINNRWRVETYHRSERRN